MSKTSETFHFDSLGELRNWLNHFRSTDLDAVLPEGGDFISLDWVEETLSDGSKVSNVRLSIQEVTS